MHKLGCLESSVIKGPVSIKPSVAVTPQVKVNSNNTSCVLHLIHHSKSAMDNCPATPDDFIP